ncbi:hypothetical protein, partial [Halomarina rubra]
MPTIRVRYTGDEEERFTNSAGQTLADVSPDDRLCAVSEELGDFLVANYEFEYYTGMEQVAGEFFTNVDGLDIAPDSVTTQVTDTERLSVGPGHEHVKPSEGT